MFVRDPFTTETGLLVGNPVALGLGNFPGPLPVSRSTVVEARDGSRFEIPGGQVGSYAWVRQASLLAAEFHNGGDDASAYAWTREYNKRLLIWNQAQAGADLQAIIASAEPDLLAPLRLVYDAVTGLLKGVGQAGSIALDWARFLPVLLVGGLAVIAYGFSKNAVSFRR